MRIDTSKLLSSLTAAAFFAVAGPVYAIGQNTNTTIQEGMININRTFQCGDSNDNVTYQSGRVNINRTVQTCGGNQKYATRSGRVNANRMHDNHGDRQAGNRHGEERPSKKNKRKRRGDGDDRRDD
jgi:hypothetical protein